MSTKWTISKMKEAFALGEIDILYRVWIANKCKISGWRSFKHAMKIGNPPWPWEMAQSKVEWKVKKL